MSKQKTISQKEQQKASVLLPFSQQYNSQDSLFQEPEILQSNFFQQPISRHFASEWEESDLSKKRQSNSKEEKQLVEEREEDYEEMYEPEVLLSKRIINGTVEYLVKWVELPFSENTWEPAENIQACAFDLIQEFEYRNQSDSKLPKSNSSNIDNPIIRSPMRKNIVSSPMNDMPIKKKTPGQQRNQSQSRTPLRQETKGKFTPPRIEQETNTTTQQEEKRKIPLKNDVNMKSLNTLLNSKTTQNIEEEYLKMTQNLPNNNSTNQLKINTPCQQNNKEKKEIFQVRTHPNNIDEENNFKKSRLLTLFQESAFFQRLKQKDEQKPKQLTVSTQLEDNTQELIKSVIEIHASPQLAPNPSITDPSLLLDRRRIYESIEISKDLLYSPFKKQIVRRQPQSPPLIQSTMISNTDKIKMKKKIVIDNAESEESDIENVNQPEPIKKRFQGKKRPSNQPYSDQEDDDIQSIFPNKQNKRASIRKLVPSIASNRNVEPPIISNRKAVSPIPSKRNGVSPFISNINSTTPMKQKKTQALNEVTPIHQMGDLTPLHLVLRSHQNNQNSISTPIRTTRQTKVLASPFVHPDQKTPLKNQSRSIWNTHKSIDSSIPKFKESSPSPFLDQKSRRNNFNNEIKTPLKSKGAQLQNSERTPLRNISKTPFKQTSRTSPSREEDERWLYKNQRSRTPQTNENNRTPYYNRNNPTPMKKGARTPPPLKKGVRTPTYQGARTPPPKTNQNYQAKDQIFNMSEDELNKRKRRRMSPCEGNLIEKNNSNCTPIRRSLRTAGTPISTALKDDRISRKQNEEYKQSLSEQYYVHMKLRESRIALQTIAEKKEQAIQKTKIDISSLSKFTYTPFNKLAKYNDSLETRLQTVDLQISVDEQKGVAANNNTLSSYQTTNKRFTRSRQKEQTYTIQGEEELKANSEDERQKEDQDKKNINKFENNTREQTSNMGNDKLFNIQGGKVSQRNQYIDRGEDDDEEEEQIEILETLQKERRGRSRKEAKLNMKIQTKQNIKKIKNSSIISEIQEESLSSFAKDVTFSKTPQKPPLDKRKQKIDPKEKKSRRSGEKSITVLNQKQIKNFQQDNKILSKIVKIISILSAKKQKRSGKLAKCSVQLPAFEVEFEDGTTDFIPHSSLLEDHPRIIAEYFIKDYI